MSEKTSPPDLEKRESDTGGSTLHDDINIPPESHLHPPAPDQVGSRRAGAGAGGALPSGIEKMTTDGRVELTEDDCYDDLGFNFSWAKKWYILTIVFWVQVSMNFNTSLYNNGVPGMAEEFGISEQAARCGAMIFLVMYAFGCELWAPWSEEFGRWPILQLSLFFVNIFQLPVALAPNFASVMVGRALGGLSTAGGSVTLGLIADMWEPETQQYAVAYVVFSSVGGSVLGPIVGGFVEEYLDWRWAMWIQLILGVVVQAIHFLTVPETRTTILMNRIAKKRRADDPSCNVYGPDELHPFKERFSAREIFTTWVRPFRMFVTEPIVAVLSLLSGFADALIFMWIHSFGLMYGDVYDFGPIQVGLAFIPIGLAYLLTWLAFIPSFKRGARLRKERPDDEHAQYESRLWFLLYTAPFLPLGLMGFGWVIRPEIHWVVSMIFAGIVGVANYAIYMATIDYMICAYGPYSASATGGNGWARDFLAGVLVLPSHPFFNNIGHNEETFMHFTNAIMILFTIASILVGAVYVIYWLGPTLRRRSPFAQQLASERTEAGTSGRRASIAYSVHERRKSSMRPQQ